MNVLEEVSIALNKIDRAVVALQKLADLEPQEFPNRPRLAGLRALSRDLAKCESRLMDLYR